MMPRSVLMTLVVSAVVLTPVGMVSAAPVDGGPRRDHSVLSNPPVAPGQPNQADLDGDRISDDFEPRLNGAGAAERLDVIVTGVESTIAQGAVGAFDVKYELPIINGFAATMTAGQARGLSHLPGLRRIEEDGVVRILDDATNSDFGANAALGDRTDVDGSGVGICVVDTGLYPAHEQIAPRTVAFKDFVNGRTAAYDDHGHGTHVMSIAAGDGAGGGSAATFRGVAPAANLYAAKVLDSSGYGSDSAVIAGIEWCQTEMSLDQPNGVDVISLSLGDTIDSNGTDAVSKAVNAAAAGGDVVVVAAGNSGDVPESINAPGVATGAVTVGAVSDWSAPVGTVRHDDGIWLASFSSRGPTIDNRIKPDIAAPGVTVTAANAGTISGYVTMSGTSMATPYVSGAMALAAEAAPTASAAGLRAALTSTAIDRGPAGADNEWGAGLIDVRAFVDAAAGAPTTRHHTFPTWERRSGTVGHNGTADFDITIPSDGLGVPLVAMLTTTSGQLICDLYCQIGFSAGEWSPDIDMQLYDPSGDPVADSQCALSGVTCTTGRQETVAIRPQVSGTYRLHVFVWTGGDGTGGDFGLDISHGPLIGTATEPPPPTNLPPVANAGPDQSVKVNRKTKAATFTLNASASSDPNGDPLTYSWSTNGAFVGGGMTLSQTQPVGTYVYTVTVADNYGASNSDDVAIVVRSR